MSRHFGTSQPAEPGPDFGVEWARFLTELRSSVTETLSGVQLRGAKPVAVGISPGATTRPTTSAGAVVGFALRNRSVVETASVTVYLYNGADDQADMLLAVTLAPGESTRDWFGPGGIHVGDQGLFVLADGDFDGSLFMRGVEL
jgi:hypothetical protein